MNLRTASLLVIPLLSLSCGTEPEPDPEPYTPAWPTLTCDELCRRLDQPVERLLPRLCELELAGNVVRAPGGLYRLAVRSG